MPVVTLTPAFMAAGLVAQPGDKRTEYCDTEVRGLLIECRSAANAVPTWYLRYKANGKTAYTRLGNVQELGLAKARQQAIMLKAQHTLAPKQTAAEKPPIGSMPLGVFMSDHYFPHVRVHKRSHKRDDQLYRIRIAPKFGHLALSAINRRDVQAFHSGLLAEGLSPASTDHHAKLLRRVCNLAVEWELLEKNPLKGFQLFGIENELNDFPDDDGLQRLLEVLRTDDNRPVCLILMFLLSTGARLNEALQARWAHIEIEQSVWLIPASNSKSKRIRSVPINESAHYILNEICTRGKSEYVFPNRKTGKPFVSISKVWYRIRKKSGISNMRIHSFRHGFASLLVSNNRSLYEVSQILGHADPRTSIRYSRLSKKALQEAANAGSIIVRKPVVTAEQEIKEA